MLQPTGCLAVAAALLLKLSASFPSGTFSFQEGIQPLPVLNGSCTPELFPSSLDFHLVSHV